MCVAIYRKAEGMGKFYINGQLPEYFLCGAQNLNILAEEALHTTVINVEMLKIIL